MFHLTISTEQHLEDSAIVKHKVFNFRPLMVLLVLS